jgi:hypothetical protein
MSARSAKARSRRPFTKFDNAVAGVLARLWRGERLHHEHVNGSARWWLSRGSPVPDRVARTVIANPNVCSEGGALFGATAQSFCWIDFTTNHLGG